MAWVGDYPAVPETMTIRMTRRLHFSTTMLNFVTLRSGYCSSTTLQAKNQTFVLSRSLDVSRSKNYLSQF